MNRTLKILVVILLGTIGSCAVFWWLGVTAPNSQQAAARGNSVGIFLAILLLVLMGLAVYQRINTKGGVAGSSQTADPAVHARWVRVRIWLLGGLVVLLVGGALILARNRSGTTQPGSTKNESGSSPARELQGYPGGIGNIAFNPDGTLLAAGGSRRAVMVWDLNTSGSETYLEPADLGVISGLAFSSDGSRLFAGGNAELWDWDTGTPSSIAHMQVGGGTTMSSRFHISQAGNRAAFADAFGNFSMMEVGAEGVLRNVIRDDPEGATTRASLAFSPDGSLLFVGRGKEIARWDTQTGALLDRFPVDVVIANMTLSSDGRVLAIGSNQTDARLAVQLWDVATGAFIAALESQAGESTSLAFSPDGTLLASSSTNDMIHIWDVKSQRKLAELTGPTGWGVSLVFSPDGTLLASGGRDGIVRLWNVDRVIP